MLSQKGDKKLEVVDLNTNSIVKRFDLGINPHEIEVSKEGIAYISNTANGFGDTINVIDLNQLKKLPDLETKFLKGPHGLSERNGFLWFTAQGSKLIGRINLDNKKIDLVQGTGADRTHMLYVSRNGKFVYSTNVGSGTISSLKYEFVKPHMAPTGKIPPGLKGKNDWVHREIVAFSGIEGFHVSPNEKELWAISPDNTNIYVIDLKTDKVKYLLDTKRLGGHRLKFSNDGTKVIVTNIRESIIQIFDVKNKKMIKEFSGCKGESIYFDKHR